MTTTFPSPPPGQLGDTGLKNGRPKFQLQFTDAAWGLKRVGEISELVFSDSGVHLILRLA